MGDVVSFFFLVVSLLADSAEAGAESCGTDWLYNSHHKTCVKPVNSMVSWFQARDNCSEDGATLLHVNSGDMEKFLGDKLTTLSGKRIWITSNDILEEGTWRGVFGRRVSFLDWVSGQPNDGMQDGASHTQNCIMDIVASANKMEDKACSSNLYSYICERWPREVYGATFVKLTQTERVLINYGVAAMFPTTGRTACAKTCLQKYFYCEVYMYSERQQQCWLLRLYEEGHVKAFSEQQLEEMKDGANEVFRLDDLSM